MAWIEIQSFLHGHVARNVLPAIPVQPFGGCCERIAEALDLLGLVVAPRRVSCLRQPDLQAGLVAIEDGPHRLQMRVEAAPRTGLAVPRSWKTMEADRRHRAEDAALAHQLEPVRIERARTAENRLEAALLDPVRGIADHLTEQQPVVILAPVPVEQIIGFVPELDMAEVLAVTVQHAIDKVGVIAQPPRRSAAQPGARQRRWRVVDTGQQVERLPQGRDQPVVPVLAAGRLVIGPGQVGAQAGGADTTHAVDGGAHAGMFTGAEPLDETERTQSGGGCRHAVHAINPRASSWRRASSPRSVACEPRIQAAASPMVCSSGSRGS